jgi:hypothetical protein
MSGKLSNKTKQAIKKYGMKSCIEWYNKYQNSGDGANTLSIYFEQLYNAKCTTRQMDSRIDAGREVHALDEEIKREILFQLNRMKLEPIDSSSNNSIEFIANYNSSSLLYMRKHWLMKFKIDFNGWVVGIGEMDGMKFQVSMTNQ